MPDWIVNINGEADLAVWVNHLAPVLRPGLVITLDGQLGAGKTHFVRALAAACGVNADQVNSPTYVIVQHYLGDWSFHHFDWYRLKDEDEWDELGAEDLLEGEGICLIEWASRFPRLLPDDHLAINIFPTGTQTRKFRLVASGENSQDILSKWRSSFS